MGYIIRLSLANIKLRKLRTALTIVGIMIGIMSIVSMLTTGLGAKQTMKDEVERTSSTKEITVETQNTKRKDRLITDSVISRIEKLDNVEGVYPVISVYGQEKLGEYSGSNFISGVPLEYMKYLSINDGEIPEGNGSRPELILGKGAKGLFFNEKTWQMLSETDKADQSFVGKRMDFAINELDKPAEVEEEEEEKKEENKENEETASPGDADDSKETKTEKEDKESKDEEPTYHKLRIVGETDNEYNYTIYTDIDTLKMYLKRQAVDGRIPGQPLDKNNRPYSVWAYSSLIIRVDSVENVEHVSKVIKDMGFQVENNLEILKSVTRTVDMIQFVLGVIGAIAAVVAVIGIINTMMTAVYDRVREIGLLKMLGSDSDDITFMFLFESALMGFIGGVLGVGLSCLVNIFINKRLVEFLQMPEGTWIMTPPAWLLLSAVAASVIVSVLAGAFPAKWAAKIKPLEAIAG